MNAGPRTPPRFVPTLTTVVEPAAAPSAEEAASATPTTATSEVHEAAGTSPRQDTAPAPAPSQQALKVLDDAEAFRVEEELLHRVLQRVDFALEERVTEVVSAAVQQQLDEMLPRLRNEIETVLRGLVIEAFAQELAEKPGAAPASDAPALG